MVWWHNAYYPTTLTKTIFPILPMATEGLNVYLMATSRLSISLFAFCFELCYFRCAVSTLVIGVCLFGYCRSGPGLVCCLLRSTPQTACTTMQQLQSPITRCTLFSASSSFPMVRVNRIYFRQGLVLFWPLFFFFSFQSTFDLVRDIHVCGFRLEGSCFVLLVYSFSQQGFVSHFTLLLHEQLLF